MLLATAAVLIFNFVVCVHFNGLRVSLAVVAAATVLGLLIFVA